jgi:NAD(P)-dependent dehydrogenase (short-subunit alcohol dehydrogenase family)
MLGLARTSALEVVHGDALDGTIVFAVGHACVLPGRGLAQPDPWLAPAGAHRDTFGVVELRMDGKAAVVTGGSKGIGKGIAKAFAEAGGQVLITARKPDTLESAAAELGPNVSWTTGHTGRPEDGERVIAECIERYGSCDVLVNNAATNPHAGLLIEAPLSAWDKTVEVNLRGPLAWSQAVWKAWMKDHSGCSIINIASVGGYKTSPTLGLYAVLKAALIHMTKQLAAELAPNVRVNAIAPAVIKTDFARILWEGERGEKTAKTYPLQRLGEPVDIGEAALYLAAGASWMTGQTLVLDGGGLISFGPADED